MQCHQKTGVILGEMATGSMATKRANTLYKARMIVLSSAAKPGTHFLENNKIIGVFTMLKLCMSKERNM